MRSLLVFLLLTLTAWAAGGVIEPGKGVTGLQLGENFAPLKAALGPPRKVDTSASDSSTHMFYYQNVALLVNRQDKIIGVTVLGNTYATEAGLHVGSAQAEVKKVYGEGLVRGQGNLTYAERGIGFSFNTRLSVTHIYIFKPEGQRPLLGDRLLVGGKRAGDLKLGMGLESVTAAWGKAEVSPLQGGAEIWSYPKQKVRLVVLKGHIDGILVNTGDFITAKGAKVGSLPAEVERALGKPATQNEKSMIYPRLGIGFVFQGGQATEVQILYPR